MQLRQASKYGRNWRSKYDAMNYRHGVTDGVLIIYFFNFFILTKVFRKPFEARQGCLKIKI